MISVDHIIPVDSVKINTYVIMIREWSIPTVLGSLVLYFSPFTHAIVIFWVLNPCF